MPSIKIFDAEIDTSISQREILKILTTLVKSPDDMWTMGESHKEKKIIGELDYSDDNTPLSALVWLGHREGKNGKLVYKEYSMCFLKDRLVTVDYKIITQEELFNQDKEEGLI